MGSRTVSSREPRATHVRSFGFALPPHRASQSDVVRFLTRVAAHAPDGLSELERRKLERSIERVFAASGIRHRHSVIGDFISEPSEFTFFSKNWELEPFPTTAERMRLFRREAPRLAKAAADRCLESAMPLTADSITHLIVASCTGFFAPGIDVQLVSDLGLSRDVQRTHIGFMGCYAAFNALRAADAICRSSIDATVLVVCVELCSIHFQRELTMSNIVGNCLFGDGAGAVLLTSEPEGSSVGLLRVIGSHTELHPGGGDLLTWDVGDTGFEMTLGAEVPGAIESGVVAFADTLCVRTGCERGQINQWAFHPGGRRILDVLGERLTLDSKSMEPSYAVLAEVGNLSSPTILFALDRALRGTSAGERCVAMGFGPGLTFESMMFEAL